jgi:hypothetical protein
MASWHECIDPSKTYAAEEIASLLGVDFLEITYTMQVGIIRAEQRRDDNWYAKGRDLLEWDNNPVLHRDVTAPLDPIVDQLLAKIAECSKADPEPHQETQSPTAPVVYFARCGEHIKIGFTRGRPEKRLKGLATANPSPIELVATMPGCPELEHELHERFSAYRTKGEWFVFSDPIREYIASLEG